MSALLNSAQGQGGRVIPPRPVANWRTGGAPRRSAAGRWLLLVVLEPSIGGRGWVARGLGGADPGVDGEHRDECTSREDDGAGQQAGNVAVCQRHRWGVAWQVASGNGRGDGGQ